jgi:UDP:flavonoid glycosyltransferase YjiC (YdhE family)
VSSLGGIATVYAPGIARHLGTLQSHLAGVHWAPGPYDLRAACAQADAVVCNGGFGTVWTAILAGVPVLCLPSHREQAILSERVVEREVGLIGPTRSGNAFDLRSMLLELLENDRYRSACARVAAKYRDAKDTVAEIVRASLGPSRGVAG